MDAYSEDIQEEPPQEILFTTTDIIQGYENEKYFGVVSARIVVGAGLFSEFFAGFTDVFGGRSEKFENRLDELNETVMKSLNRKAIDYGANAVLGLSIDIDEISGKSTQMFMVSGTVTAVSIKSVNKDNQIQNIQEPIKTLDLSCIMG